MHLCLGPICCTRSQTIVIEWVSVAVQCHFVHWCYVIVTNFNIIKGKKKH